MAKRKKFQSHLNIKRIKMILSDKKENPIDFGDAVVLEETLENDTPIIVGEKLKLVMKMNHHPLVQ